MLLIIAAISTVFTLIHTVEETDGKIWESLGVPKLLYFGFQGTVLSLGIAAPLMGGIFAQLFVGIRLFDLTYTHLWKQHPGNISAALLWVDAAIVAKFIL